ncbi:hypothetical protein SO802_006083 [Lithocarpus litseifolius]|uniref:RNase H type-1 domain-containing protein n=1 Tax=Lithocarpus litseifolius TaxID=425828 RepID=A0AAW2DP44_9ROSI
MFSCLKILHQAFCSNDIEAMAIVWALFFTSNVGVKRAVLEGDSLAVIKGLREDDSSLATFGLLVEDAKVLSQQFDELLYSHTKRESNMVAYTLARYAIGILDFVVWIEDVSPQLHSILKADLLGLFQ